MWTLRVAIILALCAALGCSDYGTPTQPSASIQSFLPTPPRPFSGGTLPPSYAGVWVGQISQTNCRSSINGFCRYLPRLQEVTLRLNQSGIAIAGTMVSLDPIDQLLGGYVAEDGAFFSPISDSGLRIVRVGELLNGIRVRDTYGPDSQLMRSELFELTGLRRSISPLDVVTFG